MRAVVTAGGTREPIDDVRAIANHSSGRYGCAIARALLDHGVAVTLLASRDLAERPERIPDGVEVVPFGSAADLAAALDRAVGEQTDLVFMAAAVADYSPEPAAGKIRSDADELVLRLRRNPKLLAGLRERLPDAVLVGFKLLSHVGPDELARVGLAQCARDRLDLTVANDLAELAGDRHPVTVCASDGSVTRIEGERQATARRVVELALDRLRASDPVLEPLAALAGGSGLPLVDRGHALRERLPWVACLLHLPGVLAVPDALVEVPFAWGSPEEAAQIESALAGARRWHRAGHQAFSVVASDGTAIVGLEADGLERLAREWELAVAEHGDLDPRPEIRRKPIFEGGRIAGVAAEHATATGPIRSIHLRRAFRGRGVGDRLAMELDRLGEPILGPAAWWVERGWRVAGAGDPLSRLEPPSRRTDLIHAASVCLFDPLRRRVLLGRRATGPAAGSWAFPGGTRAGDEPPFATAARELTEETGLPMPPLAASWSAVAHAGDGERAWEIHCFGVVDLSGRAPSPTAELAAEWVPWESALALRPMTAGTRRILRRVAEWA